MPRAALGWHILRSLPWALLAASAAGYALLAVQSQALVLPALCVSSAVAGATWDSIRAALMFNPPERLALGWLAMLLAMMPLLLHRPLAHLWHRSLRRRRFRAVAVFVLGYTLVWLAAGGILMLAALALRASADATVAFAIAALIAVAWQAAPLKQRFLNACHRQPRIAAFGLAADVDALVFGFTHGAWCAGTCWALMLLPLSAGDWHLPVMLAVTLLVLTERYRRPRLARWAIPLAMPALPRTTPIPARLRSAP